MFRHQRTLWIAALIAVAGLSQTVQAQRPGGRPGGIGTGGQPPRPTAPGSSAGNGSGNLMRIVKYTPADESKNPDLIGTLLLKPFKTGAKSVNVRILKAEDASINVGSIAFTPDRYAEILTKGLQVAVSWNNENEKPTSPKNMTSVNFRTIRVIGLVDKVEGDVITLKRALPSDGSLWPDDEIPTPPAPRPPPPASNKGGATKPKPNNSAPKPPPKPRAAKPRQIKMRALEEVSKMTGEENEEIAVGDLKEGAKVEVEVVLSNATGILTTLVYTNANPLVNRETGPLPPSPPGGGGRGGGPG